MYVFGGHDGTRHLNDVHCYDFLGRMWSVVVTEGVGPVPRDSHVSVVHGRSMYVFGGSTGASMNDLSELRLDTCKWKSVTAGRGEGQPGHRFCHVGVVEGDSMFIFGGYDGTNRLNDFWEFRFGTDLTACTIPPATILSDLLAFVGSESLSDITFLVEGQEVHAHKIMLMRCSYFRAMLEGGFRESTEQRTIPIQGVRKVIFLALLEYLYTDFVDLDLEIAMELFQAADQFGVERLKIICEHKMLGSITVDNAATVFHAADVHTAKGLREKSLNFILANFEAVSKSKSFEEMARENVELVLQILKLR
ncbi:hypothetical protein TrST_g10159 [Triparma strigata]|nr:hypothetical protein TrST_g10159 [Triparma strigata]